jgi:hypothetical protein
MKFAKLCAGFALALAFGACASTPEGGASSTSGSAQAAAPSTKGKVETFSASVTSTHAAAVAALKLHGFEITTTEPMLIAGKRPNKMGLLVGSGGEKIRVSLKSLNDTSTEATVETEKTFVGYAGQKNWDEPVLASIRTSLSAQ